MNRRWHPMSMCYLRLTKGTLLLRELKKLRRTHPVPRCHMRYKKGKLLPTQLKKLSRLQDSSNSNMPPEILSLVNKIVLFKLTVRESHHGAYAVSRLATNPDVIVIYNTTFADSGVRVVIKL